MGKCTLRTELLPWMTRFAVGLFWWALCPGRRPPATRTKVRHCSLTNYAFFMHHPKCSSVCKKGPTYLTSKGQVFLEQWALDFTHKFCVRVTPLRNPIVLGRGVWGYILSKANICASRFPMIN